MTELLRLVRQLDPTRDAVYAQNPHAGLIVCRQHLEELQNYGVEPMADVIPQDTADLVGHACALCSTPESPRNLCENEECRAPLHPRWPAVYCCNDCAHRDNV